MSGHTDAQPRRRGRQARVAAETPQQASQLRVAWSDLSDAEHTALKRMNRGVSDALAAELGERLIHLGLAVRRNDGIGISRNGRELVIDTLLQAGKKDGDRP